MRDLLFTVIPPSESMNSGKSSKSTSTMFFIFRPFPRKDSTVSIVSAGPPSAYAALTLLIPWPGTSTSTSRGIESLRTLPKAAWTSMIVSERPGPCWDSSMDSPVRTSEPSTRMLLPPNRLPSLDSARSVSATRPPGSAR